MLFASVVINALLLAVLAATIIRAKVKIRNEKLATFAGCLDAITSGLGREDKLEQVELTALSLSSMLGGIDKEEVRWRLGRASMIRIFRDVVAGDVLGEHGRLMALQAVGSTFSNEDEVWDYIDAWEKGMQEPRERFDDSGLAGAQFKIESALLNKYGARIGPDALKIFG